MCEREVFIQAQLSPRHALASSQRSLVIFARHKFEEHHVEVCAHRWGESSHSGKLLSRGGNNLGAQLHLALQQLCVEPLH